MSKKHKLRPPSEVMRLSRMGSFHQTRLSFMRSLLRMLENQNWRFDRPSWEIDDRGVGYAIYTASGNGHTYSLVCFANDLPPEKRSDRVIAEEWDATFVLYDGTPDQEDISRLYCNVPKQEAGHCFQTELVLSRANRSVRLFEHVVGCLAEGRQPDPEQIDSVGYLMRTTAVYGNGKFGISDRERISDRPEFSGPFRAELLAVWLIRAFSVDIAEHLAIVRGGKKAVPLDAGLRRRLGVGNATGLGMAPFLVLHPVLIHSWMLARETALQRVRNIPEIEPISRERFHSLMPRINTALTHWNTDDARQQERIAGLREDVRRLQQYLENFDWSHQQPWNRLFEWGQRNLALEAQELLVSILIEPHGEIVDDLTSEMSADEVDAFSIDGKMSVAETITSVEEHYSWALGRNYESMEEQARFWYVSEEKQEPRLGERFEEPGAELEHPLTYARDISRAYDDLTGFQSTTGSENSIAEFLLQFPGHRHAIRRIQVSVKYPYAEIRDNLISSEVMPIDLLRCKLSFFGASKFDPKSDRWVRINMYQYAPYPSELHDMGGDNWIYPPDHIANAAIA